MTARPATTAAACGPLCGQWELDASRSDSLDATLDKAFAKFKPPRPHRMHGTRFDNVEAMTRAADEDALGPILERPPMDILREEMTQTLAPPQLLTLDGAAQDILIAADGRSALRLTPGEPHARVDAFGTARIRTAWQGSQLVVSESYDHRNELRRSYALPTRDGALIVTQAITRPGLPATTLRSVYRRRP